MGRIASSRIQIQVSPDGMTAAVTVVPGAAAGMDELRSALAGARVVLGCDPAEVEAIGSKLADEGYTVHDRVIARGQPASAGRDGYFEPAFHAGIQPGHLDEHGTIDFFDRELLKPVAKDDYLGWLHPPVSGSSGYRIDGVELPVEQVRPSSLRAGPTVRLASDGRAYAALDGVVQYVPEQTLDIVRQYTHEGDVDLRSGSLDMQGALIVRGSVQHRFNVRCAGAVEIFGNVESGSVYASEDLRVHGTVRGGDSGMVCAEGAVTARNAEAARILAGGQLVLDTAINSDLAASAIVVTRTLRGGQAHAETTLVAQEIGTPRGNATTVAVAIPLARPVLDARRLLAAAKDERALHKAGAGRGADDRDKGGRAGRGQAAIERAGLAHKAAVAVRRQDLRAVAKIQVLGTAHPGVTLQVGAQRITLDKPLSGSTVSIDPRTLQIRTERLGR